MKAEEYIYIEDQYFNSEEIVESLKARLKERPQLEVILVVNPRPKEVGGYHPHQTKLIKELIAAGREARVAAFTMWSCDARNPVLAIAPVYVHQRQGLHHRRPMGGHRNRQRGQRSMNARQWQIILPGTLDEFFHRGSKKAKLVMAI